MKFQSLSSIYKTATHVGTRNFTKAKQVLIITSRLVNFLGFEFLTRNEEKNEFPHEERGIFEESPNLI